MPFLTFEVHSGIARPDAAVVVDAFLVWETYLHEPLKKIIIPTKNFVKIPVELFHKLFFFYKCIFFSETWRPGSSTPRCTEGICRPISQPGRPESALPDQILTKKKCGQVKTTTTTKKKKAPKRAPA